MRFIHKSYDSVSNFALFYSVYFVCVMCVYNFYSLNYCAFIFAIVLLFFPEMCEQDSFYFNDSAFSLILFVLQHLAWLRSQRIHYHCYLFCNTNTFI